MSETPCTCVFLFPVFAIIRSVKMSVDGSPPHITHSSPFKSGLPGPKRLKRPNYF